MRLSEGFVCFISVNFQCNPLRQSTFNLTVSIFFMKKPRLREARTFLISYILYKDLDLWVYGPPEPLS